MMQNKHLIRSWSVILIVIAALGSMAIPVAAQTNILPLTASGAYKVDRIKMTFTDAQRANRAIETYIYYPALVDDSAKPPAPPDKSGAPYPLILYSGSCGGGGSDVDAIDRILASRGFVVVGLTHPNDDSQLNMVDRPVDMLFVLNQLAATTSAAISGLIDTNHTGVFGFSCGAYTTLAMTGARIDPVAAGVMTAKPLVRGDTADIRYGYPDWNWDTITAYRNTLSSLPNNSLWPPFTDKRILADAMFEPCNAQLFGEQGLAAATVPSIMIVGTADDGCPYQQDGAFILAHLGSADRYLISVIDGLHGVAIEFHYESVTTQLMVAFFGFYLQGKQAYTQYLTAKYVDSVESQMKLGLVWGLYTKP